MGYLRPLQIEPLQRPSGIIRKRAFMSYLGIIFDATTMITSCLPDKTPVSKFEVLVRYISNSNSIQSISYLTGFLNLGVIGAVVARSYARSSFSRAISMTKALSHVLLILGQAHLANELSHYPKYSQTHFNLIVTFYL